MVDLQEAEQDSVFETVCALAWAVLVLGCPPAVVVALVVRLCARVRGWGWGVLAVAAGVCTGALGAVSWVATGSAVEGGAWLVAAWVVVGRRGLARTGWGEAPQESLVSALLWMLPASVPMGVAAAAVWGVVSQVRSAEQASFETEMVRSVAPLTRVERRAEAKTAGRMAAGGYTRPGRVRRRPFGRGGVTLGTVALGTGLGGAAVVAEEDGLLRPVFVQGVPGSGKTAEAKSLGGQLIASGSGMVIIDFKGDREVPSHYFEVARAHGRRFLHFDLADPNGSAYTPVGDGAPQAPAYYDPLVRGNATSKTDMLLNSVGREGDAAVYFRSAYEYAQLAYLVADWSGYSYGRGGLETLVDLLDIDFLQQTADRIDIEAVAARVPPAQQVAARRAVHEVRERVATMVSNWRRDELTRSSVVDTQRLISTYSNGPAAGQWLRPGAAEQTVDLRRAAHEGDVVVFTLNVSTYGALARNLGTLVLLDLQNTTDMLRRDIAAGADPWPLYVQIEEFGSADGEAVLGLCNKARDARLRPFLSTQSWADLEAVDGTGVWARRVLETCGTFLCFRANTAEDAEVLAGVTGEVTKVYARVQHRTDRHGRRVRRRGGLIQRDPRREPRVPASVFQGLPDHHMVWITKHPELATVHSREEGPNQWWESVHTVLVDATLLASVRPIVVEWRADGTWGRPGEPLVPLVKQPPVGVPTSPQGLGGAAPTMPVPSGRQPLTHGSPGSVGDPEATGRVWPSASSEPRMDAGRAPAGPSAPAAPSAGTRRPLEDGRGGSAADARAASDSDWDAVMAEFDE